MFYKNNDILPSVFTLPIENLQSAKVPITAALLPCIPHALTNSQIHLEKHFISFTSQGFTFPAVKQTTPKSYWQINPLTLEKLQIDGEE